MAMTLPDSSISRIMEQWVEASRLRLAGEQHSTTIGSADVLVDELNRVRLELTAVNGQRDEGQVALQRLEQALAAARHDLAELQRRYDAVVAQAAVDAEARAAKPPDPGVAPSAIAGVAPSAIASVAPSSVAVATPPPQRFDEQWYLATYPDVRDAVRRGLFGSGQQHYELHGRGEKRQARFMAG
jgi:hypothetical protein